MVVMVRMQALTHHNGGEYRHMYTQSTSNAVAAMQSGEVKEVIRKRSSQGMS